MIVRSKGRTFFEIINAVLLGSIGLLAVLPFVNVIAKSMSGDAAVIAGKVTVYPIDFQMDAFRFVILKSGFLNAFGVSLFVTAIGTCVSLLVTLMAAYPLSKPHFKGRKAVLLLYVFSMLFYGGMVPSYMLMKELRLINTVWAMIIPFIVVPFNLFVMKTFFESIEENIVEAAKIDGAGNFSILFRIVLPISTPVLATLGLFYAVGYWNNFYHPLLFISKQSLKPLQLYMYDVINSTQSASERIDTESLLNLSMESVQAATIIASTLPILLVYPFLQRHFVHGLTIGSVKG
ncbi:MAG: carbohydrate ABC transporter permease [Treponemataceae bacterium]